jgi:hypothetical protein
VSIVFPAEMLHCETSVESLVTPLQSLADLDPP